MLVDLDVAPVDLAAPVLHASFSLPRRPHLVSVRWQIAGVEVIAGILAASHQVVAHGRFVETVACDLDGGEAVADGTVAAGPHHRFRARVETLNRSDLDALVSDHLDRNPATTVIGRFPTNPLAVTVVTRRDDGWDTLHTYPTTDTHGATVGGAVVHTTTELRR